MKNTWSENIKNLTRERAGFGTMVKSLDGNSGMIVSCGEKIIINSCEMQNYFPSPTNEKIAEFDNVEKMIDAGWVIDWFFKFFIQNTKTFRKTGLILLLNGENCDDKSAKIKNNW